MNIIIGSIGLVITCTIFILTIRLFLSLMDPDKYWKK
jgi:hypothetical protein